MLGTQQRVLGYPYLSPVSPFFSPSTLSLIMVGCHISDELKQMALSMSLQGLPDSKVHKFMGISVWSLKQLQSTYCNTEGVSHKQMAPGRPCMLTAMDRKVHLTIPLNLVIISPN